MLLFKPYITMMYQVFSYHPVGTTSVLLMVFSYCPLRAHISCAYLIYISVTKRLDKKTKPVISLSQRVKITIYDLHMTCLQYI